MLSRWQWRNNNRSIDIGNRTRHLTRREAAQAARVMKMAPDIGTCIMYGALCVINAGRAGFARALLTPLNPARNESSAPTRACRAHL